MRFLIILIVLISTTSLFGQMQEEVNNALLAKNWTNFQRFAENLSKRDKNISARWAALRDLTKRHQEGIFYFEQYTPDKELANTSNVERFQVNLVHNGKEIIFYQIKQIHYKNSHKTSVILNQYKNEIAYSNFQWAYHDLYDANLNENDLFLEDIVYGERCGRALVTPKEKGLIDDFVANKDTTSLLKWLQSPNSEKQVYAVNGFYELRKTGRVLTKQEEKIIAFIIHKKGNIHICSGCIYDIDDIKNVTKKFFSLK